GVQRPATIKKIHKETKKLAALIDSNAVASAAVKKIVDLEQLVDELRRLATVRQPSLTEWLIGAALVATYEKHFGLRAAQWRKNGIGKPMGPFVAFSEAVLKALDLRCDRATIGRALSRMRAWDPGTMTLGQQFQEAGLLPKTVDYSRAKNPDKFA